MSETQRIKLEQPKNPDLLNAQQQEQLSTRALHDAELIKAGGAYNSLGHLSVTASQHERLYDENIQKPKIEKFLLNSTEGQIIQSRKDANRRAATYIGQTYLGYAGEIGEGGVIAGEQDLLDLASDGSLDVDDKLLDLAVSVGQESHARGEKHGYELLDKLAEYNQKHVEMAIVLADHPELTLSSEVIVPRSGGINESGWTIDEITSKGDLRVGKELPDNEYIYKDMTAAALVAAQQPAENPTS